MEKFIVTKEKIDNLNKQMEDVKMEEPKKNIPWIEK